MKRKMLPILGMFVAFLDCIENALSGTPHIFVTSWNWVWWLAVIGWGLGIIEYIKDHK